MTALTMPIPAMPGPRSLPVLGWRANLLPLLRDPIGYMLRLQQTYGDVVALGDNFIFVFSPEYHRQVLSDQHIFYNGEVNAPGSPVRIPPGSSAMRLFSGLTTVNGARHTQQRRLLMPAFHKKHIATLRDDMVALAEDRVADWRPGQTRDILREMKGLTLAIAVRTILGLDPAGEGEQLRGQMERWLRLALSLPVLLAPFDLPGLPFHRFLALSTQLEAEIRGMLARKRARGAAEADALSMLIQAHDEDGARLSDDQLIGHTTTLFIAGHETTASALTWTLFLLAQHPRVLADLLDELDGALHGDAPSLAQIDALPYLDAVIKESMRLLPPGLWFLRVTTAPVRFGPYAVPAGTRVLWSPAVAHRNPDIYPHPARFLPERWATIDPSPYEYMPFGAGPRRCLGATFALMEMKLVLPILLQRFRFALPAHARVDLNGSPLAAPRGGLPMLLSRPGARVAPVPVRGSIRRLVTLPGARRH